MTVLAKSMIQVYDDGTLDTVFSVYGVEIRYDFETHQPWRDEQGYIDFDSLLEHEEEEFIDQIVDEFGYRELALAIHLGCDVDEVGAGYTEYHFDAPGEEWFVLTDEEADQLAREYVHNLLDDVLEIPDWIEPYFDRFGWVEDVVSIDGRGIQLASYDGEEHYLDFDYYGYRTN